MIEFYAYIGAVVIFGLLIAVMVVAIHCTYECYTDVKHFGYINASRGYVAFTVICWIISVGGIYLMTL